jgi:hypothetical protein
MKYDRIISSLHTRFEILARPGLVNYKRCLLVVLCLLPSSFCPPAFAEGISVNKAEIRLADDVYQLSASYDIGLNPVVKEALSRGIPIYFVGEFSLTRSRWNWLDNAQRALSRSIQHLFVAEPTLTHWSWLDKEVYKSEQVAKLSYSVLTGRYRISRGALFQNFSSLEDGLNMLSRQTSTAIPAELEKTEGTYIAAARLSLDISQLPKPLQVNALTNNDWTLDSGWYSWTVSPSEIARNNKVTE